MSHLATLNHLLPLIMILIGAPLQAQKEDNYRFQYLKVEDGLPQNTITALEKDKYGFLWIATNSGICKYDSYNFEIFRSKERDGNGLADNLVRCIRAGNDDLVWIGSKNGLSFYNHLSNTVSLFCDDQKPKHAISRVNDILINDTQVWVATQDNGLFLLQKSKEQYRIAKHFSIDSFSSNNTQILTLSLSADGLLYAGTNQGFYVYESNTFVKPKNKENIPNGILINDIYTDSKGHQYFSTNNGLYFKYKEDTKIKHFVFSPNKKNSLIHNTINMAREDQSGHILIASLGGLQFFDPENKTFRNIPNQGQEHFKLNNAFINTIYCDEQGNIWVGTDKGGLNKFNIFQNSFDYMSTSSSEPFRLNNNTVNSIYSDKNELWVGTAGGGLNIFDTKKKTKKHLKSSTPWPSTMSNDFITSILKTYDGHLYASTWGGGINKISKQQGQFIVEPINGENPKYKHHLTNYFVSCMVDNKDGSLLIGTEGGISLFNYNKKTFTSLIAPENMPYSISEIGCMLLDSQGNCWVGTRNGLLSFPVSNIYEASGNNFVLSGIHYYQHKRNNSNTLPDNYIISLLEDDRGNIWAGTYGQGIGISTIDNDGRLSFSTFDEGKQLANNVIYSMLEDKQHRIWASTDFGLSVINTNTGEIKNLFKENGLLNNQYYWSSAHKGADGTLYFGGTEGLNYFHPQSFYTYNHHPQPKLRHLKVFNEEVFVKSSSAQNEKIKVPIYNTDTITLRNSDKNISFEFSAFDFYLPNKNQYAYQLSDVDKDWVYVNAQRRFASYNNLKPQSYTLRLKVSNCEGVWNDEEREICLIIKPALWQTMGFKIIIVVLILLLVYLIIRLNTKRIVEQKKALEKKVGERTNKINKQRLTLEENAVILRETNEQLKKRQEIVNKQKEQLELQNTAMSQQHNELVLLNKKIKEINLLQLRFFTNISHEFQTPLTLIISPLERLLKNNSLNKELNKTLSIVNRNAHRLLLLIKQLLEIRKIETGNQNLQVELADTQKFITDIFDSFEELAAKNNINYTCDIRFTKASWIDKDKLENILYNLLSNAFKFTPNGESIAIKAHYQNNNKGNEELILSVTDTGEGIDTKNIDILFDRFLQVTKSKKHERAGAGIGLSLVKSLVQLMHGHISVSSELNKGSNFTIQIPVSKNAFEANETDTTGQAFESSINDKISVLSESLDISASEIYKESACQVKTILVIEDNADMRNFICSELAPFYKVLEANHGKQGLEIIKKEMPSLVVSDVMMPVMDGLELCRAVKKNLYTSHIPFLMLTARNENADHLEGLETGADDYITKPFSVDILLAKIKNIIESREILKSKYGRLEEIVSDSQRISELDDRFYNKAIEIVEKFYTESEFDVDHFAAEMFVSRSQLYNKLKAISNLSANEFINTFRLKKSVDLIKEGNLQISEIAYYVGFNDPKYFSRIFKKYYQKSPSAFVRDLHNTKEE